MRLLKVGLIFLMRIFHFQSSKLCNDWFAVIKCSLGME